LLQITGMTTDHPQLALNPLRPDVPPHHDKAPLTSRAGPAARPPVRAHNERPFAWSSLSTMASLVQSANRQSANTDSLMT
ncbi:hypothetical protein ACFYZN_36305, partial [Streptomyces sp. NPDC001777]|uniref:hypothetical protein n=1 Tax=Streptomyces sp. NPDC001777 TaxID=3364608 RepID=UPI0036CCB81B